MEKTEIYLLQLGKGLSEMSKKLYYSKRDRNTPASHSSKTQAHCALHKLSINQKIDNAFPSLHAMALLIRLHSNRKCQPREKYREALKSRGETQNQYRDLMPLEPTATPNIQNRATHGKTNINSHIKSLPP